MTLSVGSKLGSYEILAPIGRGGMGEVYRARDPRMERDVAIKIIPEWLADRFSSEVRAMAALKHPHICTIHDVGPNYFVMELCEGETLAERLQRGRLSMQEALLYGSQIAEALAAAHARGIVHRDLKPGNVMLTPTGVKLLDFGLAKHQRPIPGDQDTHTWGLTNPGAFVGTLRYASPEQIKGRDIDVRTDLFSFGLVFYEMIKGGPAFEGSDDRSVMAAILERKAPSIAELASPMTDLFLQRCLEKEPEKRWQSAVDAKFLLDLVASEVGSKSYMRVLRSRDDVQTQLEEVFEAAAPWPKRVSQTVVNAFPIAVAKDFLNKVDEEGCKVTRTIVITDSCDIAFAYHSLNLAPRFRQHKIRFAFVPNLGSSLPTTINITVVDSHVFLTSPIWSGLSTWRYFDPSSKSVVFRDTTGIYIYSSGAADVFGEQVSSLGDQLAASGFQNGDDEKFLEGVKRQLIGAAHSDRPSRESFARYLFGFCIAVRTELRKSEKLASSIKFLGIVGSAARVMTDLAQGQGTGENPNDLDILIVLTDLSEEGYKELLHIAGTLCNVYSIDGVLLLAPEFHTSPAKPAGTTNWFSVQFIIQTSSWLESTGVPFIYAHRRLNHIALLGQFPKILNLETFSSTDVLEAEDGIRYCLRDLKGRRSVGYQWKVGENDAGPRRVPYPIELDDQTLVSFSWYSLHWALYNLRHAHPPIQKLRGGRTTTSTLQLLFGDKFNETEMRTLILLLDKQWAGANGEGVLRELADGEVVKVTIAALERLVQIVESEAR